MSELKLAWVTDANPLAIRFDGMTASTLVQYTAIPGGDLAVGDLVTVALISKQVVVTSVLRAPNAHPWIYVDQTAGAPLFTNSWVNFDAEPSERNVAFRKENGRVFLKGDAGGGTVGLATPIFTLPAGYTPTGNRWFFGVSNSLATLIRVGSDGTVCVNTGASNVFVDLGEVHFEPTKIAA